MYCLELIKFDVSNNIYYVEVENGVLLQDVVQSWKMILGGHEKSWKIFKGKVWEPRFCCASQFGRKQLCSVSVARRTVCYMPMSVTLLYCVPDCSGLTCYKSLVSSEFYVSFCCYFVLHIGCRRSLFYWKKQMLPYVTCCCYRFLLIRHSRHLDFICLLWQNWLLRLYPTCPLSCSAFYWLLSLHDFGCVVLYGSLSTINVVAVMSNCSSIDITDLQQLWWNVHILLKMCWIHVFSSDWCGLCSSLLLGVSILLHGKTVTMSLFFSQELCQAM